jgi:hypothetical protein
MKDEKMKNIREKVPEKELEDKIASKSETLEEANPEKKPQDDEEDILYTQKPENRGNGMQWNSAFCRRPGH